VKFPVGIGTVLGIFGGIVLGALLWLVGAGVDAAMNILPDGGPNVFFFIGFSAGVVVGLIFDYTNEAVELKVKK